MDEDRVEGTARNVGGKVQEAVVALLAMHARVLKVWRTKRLERLRICMDRLLIPRASKLPTEIAGFAITLRRSHTLAL